MKNFIAKVTEIMERHDRELETRMLPCVICGEHWLLHSQYGDYCPDASGMRREPKSRFTTREEVCHEHV